MSDLEGVLLSDYLLLECINKGGVADVYRARRRGGSGYEVAVKVFRSSYAQRESFRDYFMLEAKKIGQFDHPNILPFLEYGEGEGLLYLVTPFVTTGTLEDLLRRVGGHLSALQALPVLQQLCSAVQYTHDHTVTHGNIKPTNVFIASDGHMLLSDFGIARSYDDSQQSLTRVGWGSAEYAAPEQSLGVLRHSSDIYSLGVLLFRILSGTPPFTGQTPVEVLLKHVRQQPPSAREIVPTISEAVDSVLRTALQKRSDDRFASAEKFSNAFLTAVKVAPVASPLSKPAGVTLPLFVAGSTLTNPPTPVPALNPQATVNDPLTPLPAFIALAPSAALEEPGEVSDPILTNEASSLQEVEAPSLTPEEPDGSDVTKVRQKDFLQEDDEQNFHPFWSVDPQEWSPLASDQVADAPGAVPLTAGEYLHTKPLTSDPPLELEASPAPENVTREMKGRKRKRKWLTIAVVVLLLLGLLGALLSAFLFPVEKSDNSTTSAPAAGTSSGAVMTRRALSTPTKAATPKATLTARSVATATPLVTQAPKPGTTPVPSGPPAATLSCTSGSITLDGSGNFQSVIQRMTSDYTTQCPNAFATFTVNADGSKAGLDSVANGSSDLAYSDLPSASRPGLVDNPVAAFTYAVIVSSDVGVTNLTTAQLRSIYTGKITNWSQVGGPDESIAVVSRASDAAIRAIFEAYVLNGVTQSVNGVPLWFQPDTSDAVVQAVQGRNGAISYIPLFYAANDGVQTVSINGVKPTTASVASGAYPFWSIEHLYSNGDAVGLARTFITFCAITSGQNDLANYDAISIKRMSQSVISAHGSGPAV